MAIVSILSYPILTFLPVRAFGLAEAVCEIAGDMDFAISLLHSCFAVECPVLSLSGHRAKENQPRARRLRNFRSNCRGHLLNGNAPLSDVNLESHPV
jgi:hypothetical protein